MIQLRCAFRNAFRRWLRRWKLRRAYRHAIVGVDLSTTSDMTAGPPVNPAKPSEELPPSIARSVMIGEAVRDGLAAGLAVGTEAPPATLYADNRPVVTIRMDGIDAFMYSLHAIGRAVAQAAAAFRAIAAATTDAALIAAYATPKETHYIIHGRKARTRKKYRNRVLRRARRARKKEART